jgi:hypothetical protein
MMHDFSPRAYTLDKELYSDAGRETTVTDVCESCRDALSGTWVNIAACLKYNALEAEGHVSISLRTAGDPET